MRARAFSGTGERIDRRARTPARRSTCKGGKNLRKLWRNLHLALALAAGFLFVLMGLTGSCKVFMDELDEVFNPDLVIQTPAREPLPLDDLLGAAQAALEATSERTGLSREYYTWRPAGHAKRKRAPCVKHRPCSPGIVVTDTIE